MLSLINWRLKVTINDGRALTGQMLAFDRHMNLVLADCEEFRRVRPKKKAGEETAPEQEMKRTLGLVILRGETVVSISVEGPPPVVDEDKKANAVRDWTPYKHQSATDLFFPAPDRSWSWYACRARDGYDATKYVHLSIQTTDSILNSNSQWVLLPLQGHPCHLCLLVCTGPLPVSDHQLLSLLDFLPPHRVSLDHHLGRCFILYGDEKKTLTMDSASSLPRNKDPFEFGVTSCLIVSH